MSLIRASVLCILALAANAAATAQSAQDPEFFEPRFRDVARDDNTLPAQGGAANQPVGSESPIPPATPLTQSPAAPMPARATEAKTAQKSHSESAAPPSAPRGRPAPDTRVLHRDPRKAKTNVTEAQLTDTKSAFGWNSWARSGVSLAAIVGAICLLAWGYRALAGGRPILRSKRAGLIEVISRASLSSRQSLALIRIGPRAVLVAYSQDRTSVLDVVADADLVAQFAGQAVTGQPTSAASEFRLSLAKQQSAFDRKARPATPSSMPIATNPPAADDDLDAAKRRLAEVLAGLRNVSRPA